MSSKLDLDPGVIEDCCAAAVQIASGVAEAIESKTTVSVERTVARLLGVDGANELEVPLPNVLVDHVREGGELGLGIAYWLGNAMLQREELSPQQIAEEVAAGRLDLCALPGPVRRNWRRRTRSGHSARRWGRARGPCGSINADTTTHRRRERLRRAALASALV